MAWWPYGARRPCVGQVTELKSNPLMILIWRSKRVHLAQPWFTWWLFRVAPACRRQEASPLAVFGAGGRLQGGGPLLHQHRLHLEALVPRALGAQRLSSWCSLSR
eukprot:5398167-Pyramimonas_sp.AAC.1